MVQDRARLTMADQQKSYMVYRTAPLSIFNDLERPKTQISRSRHYLMLNLRNGTRYRDIYNEILLWIYALLKINLIAGL